MKDKIEVPVIHLFPVLDRMLTELLTGLTEEEWNAPTVARLWKVKDVAAHLLDGNLRALSVSRDKYTGEAAENINSYEDLVGFINDQNLLWTKAARRISPAILISLLNITGREYVEHLQTLNPFEDAVFSVAWAGQATSPNWFHIAREYTEKFLHQQQIRDAVGKPGLLTRTLYFPFIDTLMYAFPYTFKDVVAEEGTIVSLIITTEAGGRWNIVRTRQGWMLHEHPDVQAHAIATIDPDTAWKLFSKSRRPEEVMDKIKLTGEAELGRLALQMVSVMA